MSPHTHKRYNTKNIYPDTPQKTTRKNKFDTEICDNKMTFQECEVAILRHAIDEMDTKRGEKTANSPDVVKMIRIVEDFLMNKKLVCYGGTAINNILPKEAQFYNKNVEVPDYDFFSPTALEHAKELADIFYKRGYDEVEAKTGVHQGTYKVFVNFIPVADITFLHPTLYTALKRESINIGGIRYAPANYLRMGMFLELSRPEGDVSRWEKVLKRLNLLNKYHPLHANGKQQCSRDVFHHKSGKGHNKSLPEKTFLTTRNSFIDQGVVFFGGYAASMYSRYMPYPFPKGVPVFDVLSENPDRCATIIKDTLQENRIRHVKLIQHTSIGEVVPEHIEVVAEGETVAYIYKPISCHSYNTITVDKKEVNIATIDTMLSFYLAFLYADKKYYDKHRILCMSAYLFQVEEHNRLAQKGVLKRFSTKCYGKQETLEDIRSKKNQLFKELSKKRKSIEYENAFLKYEPKTNTSLKRDDPTDEINTAKVEKTHVIEEDDEDDEDDDDEEVVIHEPKNKRSTHLSSTIKMKKPSPNNNDEITEQTRKYRNSKKSPRKIRYKSYRKPLSYKTKTITEKRPAFPNMKPKINEPEQYVETDEDSSSKEIVRTPEKRRRSFSFAKGVRGITGDGLPSKVIERNKSSSWMSRLNDKKSKGNFLF
jgi:hypothetical protein